MSVHQINGHWYYRFTINGVRYRKAIKEAQTKRQAERAEQLKRNQLFEKAFGESGRRNFADFVEKTYKPHSRQHKKGFEVERSVLKALLDSFGKLRLGDITPAAVHQFQQDRASEKTNRQKVRSRATVNRDVAVLSAIFKLALRLGEVRENPVSKVQYFKNLPKRDRVLSDDEERQLLKAMKNNVDLRRKFEMYLYTGLRRVELFRLEWRDIDFDEEIIYLRPETTKTGKGRKVVMFSNLRQILTDVRSELNEIHPNGRVFAGGNVHAFSEQFEQICAEAEIDGVTAHTLRHTFSTRANRLDVDPFAQKDALGHAKLSQTADYTHQSPQTFRRNWDGFEGLISQRNQFMHGDARTERFGKSPR